MNKNFLDLDVVKKHNADVIKIKPTSDALHSSYRFIRFWGRIPNYVLDDLFNLNKNKEILFDPFGGSGIVVLKGLNYNFKKIIYNDLNPAFVFLTKTFYKSLEVDNEEIKKNFNKFKKKLLSSSIILNLLNMKTDPPFIHKFAYDIKLSLNKNKKADLELLGLQTEVLKKLAKKIVQYLEDKDYVNFSVLRKKLIKILSKNYDKLQARVLFSFVLKKLIRLGFIKKEVIPISIVLSSSVTYPNDLKTLKVNDEIKRKLEKKYKKYKHFINKNVFSYKLAYPNGEPYKKAEDARKIGDLYTVWSKILLSIIWKKIARFPSEDENIIDMLKLCFLASLYDSSKMQMIHKSGWIIKSFWIPPSFGVKSPMYVFIKKLNCFISVHNEIKKEYNPESEVIFQNKDVFEFNKNIIKCKPDVVITHPPYFSTVQYGELSAIWNSWLGYNIPFEKEIIENPRQNKSKEVYLSLLRASLDKISNLSRKNATVILFFQSKNKRDWKLLDKTLMESPLRLEQVRYYERINRWKAPSRIFNIGRYDYAFVFKNR